MPVPLRTWTRALLGRFRCHILPLRSSEVSPPHLVVFFSCSDNSLHLRSPTRGCPSRGRFLSGSSNARSPSRIGVSTPCQPRRAVASRACSLPRHTLQACASDFAAVAFSAPPADSTPAAPSAMASAALTTGGASPHSCGSAPEGPTSLASVSAVPLLPSGFSTSPARLAPPIRPVAQPKCRRTIQQLLWRQRCRPRINSLCRHHTSPSHRPTSVMRPLALPSPLLRLSPSQLWSPRPRRHAATVYTS